MPEVDFGLLEVDTTSASRMPLVMPGEVDPIVDEDGNEGFLEFLPWDSDEGRKLDRELHRANVRKGFRQKSAVELRKEAEEEDPIEEQVRRLVLLVTDWHLVGPDRKVIPVPFSKENAKALFTSQRTAWMRRRAYAYVMNERNFMKHSSKSSSTSSSGAPV